MFLCTVTFLCIVLLTEPETESLISTLAPRRRFPVLVVLLSLVIFASGILSRASAFRAVAVRAHGGRVRVSGITNKHTNPDKSRECHLNVCRDRERRDKAARLKAE